MSQLAIKSLAKSYGSFKVFDGLNLSAEAGEIVVIFGGSGTGKTILLRLIAGVEEPTSGAIEIAGHDVSDIAPEHRGVGMAFQNFALFPHMNASENIATMVPSVMRSATRRRIQISCTSSGFVATRFSDFTTGGPMVMFGTKWPSMMSRCSHSAPDWSKRLVSAAKRP